MSEGKKFDAGKPRISLLPGRAIEQVILVGEFGSKKYGDHNYRNGLPVTKYLNAAYRHAFIEWLFKGIDKDPESGLPHLAHAAWNILAALEQMILKPEFDDRYKEQAKIFVPKGSGVVSDQLGNIIGPTSEQIKKMQSPNQASMLFSLATALIKNKAEEVKKENGQ